MSCIVVTIAGLADPVAVAGVVVGISGTSQDTPHSLTTAMLYISAETFSAGVSRCQPCNSGFERPAGRTAASSGIPWFVNNLHTAMRACHSTRVPPRYYRMMSAMRDVGGRRMCWLFVAVDSHFLRRYNCRACQGNTISVAGQACMPCPNGQMASSVSGRCR